MGPVGSRGHCRVDLTWGVRGETHEHVRADDLAGLRDRHVLLADVHAVGSHDHGDVWAVVEDEQRAGRVTGIRGHARRFGQELVLQVLLSQLHHIDAARDRLGQEFAQVAIARHAVAYEVQACGGQARSALVAIGVGHGPQMGHRTPV